jgi:hypothetical protein
VAPKDRQRASFAWETRVFRETWLPKSRRTGFLAFSRADDWIGGVHGLHRSLASLPSPFSALSIALLQGGLPHFPATPLPQMFPVSWPPSGWEWTTMRRLQKAALVPCRSLGRTGLPGHSSGPARSTASGALMDAVLFDGESRSASACRSCRTVVR